MRRCRRDERAVTIVEAAFALPIMFLFISGLIDLGMWTFNSNQASNAARDGARAAILDFEQADLTGSADFDDVLDAVHGHLPEDAAAASDVTVTCLTPEGFTIACATARQDGDRVKVDVEWGWRLVTPVAAVLGIEEGVAHGSATMVIVGRPVPGSSSSTTTSTTTTTSSTTTVPEDPENTTTTVAPVPCSITSLTTSPTSVPKTGNQLQQAVVISFTTNGSSTCASDLVVEVQGNKGNPAPVGHPCGCGDGPNMSWSYAGSDNIWQKGTGTVRVLDGSTVLATTTFTVT